jgi:putative SOS response-associated peptidase YedK
MPVIVANDYWQWWIDDRRNGKDVKFMLRPFHTEHMDWCRVSMLVNNLRNECPDLICRAEGNVGGSAPAPIERELF